MFRSAMWRRGSDDGEETRLLRCRGLPSRSVKLDLTCTEFSSLASFS